MNLTGFRFLTALTLVACTLTAVSAVDGAVAARPTVTAVKVTR